MSEVALTVPPAPLRSRIWRELRPVWPFLLIFGAFALVALLAPWVAPYSPNTQNLLGRLKPPGTTVRSVFYLLGTDEVGRDLLSRLIYGARVSLMVALLSVLVSTVLGTVLGMIAGFYRGAVEVVIMRLTDIVLSIPAILLAIITIAVLGPGLQNVVIVLGFTRWPRYARVAYGQTLAVMGQTFMRAAAFNGAGALRLISVRVLGIDYPWYFQSGLAGQYALGPGLQPSAFGVLLELKS